MCILLCHIYVLVLQMFISGYNSIDPLSQCKLFQRPIICLYGYVGKWIGAVTDGNKLLAICQLIWHKYSHNIGMHPQRCRIISNKPIPQDHVIFHELHQKLKVSRLTDHVIHLRINTAPTTHSPTTVV